MFRRKIRIGRVMTVTHGDHNGERVRIAGKSAIEPGCWTVYGRHAFRVHGDDLR